MNGAHVSEALHSLECEASAHAEMHRIKVLHQHGLAGLVEQRRYSGLWLALALRRSASSRARVPAAMAVAADNWHREFDALQHERTRAAVDAAFASDDDAPLSDAGSPLPR